MQMRQAGLRLFLLPLRPYYGGAGAKEVHHETDAMAKRGRLDSAVIDGPGA
jgi:hypothetical protein